MAAVAAGQSIVTSEALQRAPHQLVELTTTEKFSFDLNTLAEIQLGGLRKRFRDLVWRVPILQRVADEQQL